MAASEYREITDDEFRAVIRGRPTAPRLFVRVDEAEHYHATMEAAYPGHTKAIQARQDIGS